MVEDSNVVGVGICRNVGRNLMWGNGAGDETGGGIAVEGEVMGIAEVHADENAEEWLPAASERSMKLTARVQVQEIDILAFWERLGANVCLEVGSIGSLGTMLHRFRPHL